MPEMDGIEALKKIKAADVNASVIMCSAMDSKLWLLSQSSQEPKILSLLIPG